MTVHEGVLDYDWITLDDAIDMGWQVPQEPVNHGDLIDISGNWYYIDKGGAHIPETAVWADMPSAKSVLELYAVSPQRRQVGGTHYRDMAIQPSEYIYRNGLNWYEGNAIKYVTRHRVKGGKADIEKAIHYLELLLEQEYGGTDAA